MCAGRLPTIVERGWHIEDMNVSVLPISKFDKLGILSSDSISGHRIALIIDTGQEKYIISFTLALRIREGTVIRRFLLYF